VIAGLLLGVGFGLGVYLIGRGLLRRHVPLAVALAELERPRWPRQPMATGREGRGAERAVAALRGLGIDLDRAESDRRVAGLTVERQVLEKLTAAIVGGATPVVLAVLAGAGGLAVPYGLVVVAGLGFGTAGFVLPDMLLRGRARARRDAFRTALSAYLDLVNVLLAGAAGTETALQAAAEAGDGWAFGEIRVALEKARVLRTSPWDAFEELGAQLGVVELQELAASVRLAGEQGAKIKASLASKAASLRAQQLARTEAAAHAASERMAIPNVVMFLGFLVFAGYPALISIVGGV
jgi:Flp pilus assembly protein TadB